MKMYRFNLWVGLLALMTVAMNVVGPLQADDPRDLFEKQVWTGSAGETLPYRLLPPVEIKPGERYPLVLFLHGSGERGEDNNAQLVHVVQELAQPAIRERFPAFVLAPQCPTGQKWVDVSWETDSHQMPERPSESLASVIKLVASLQESLPVDKDRIYYTGLSMGGYGVWDLLQRQPEQCAGALAICGGGDPAYAEKMKNVPVWVFHGDADGAVKFHRSVEMVQAIRNAGGRPILTAYPGVGHDSWTVTAQNRLVWDWLFVQSR